MTRKYKWKRAISMVLTLALLIGMVPALGAGGGQRPEQSKFKVMSLSTATGMMFSEYEYSSQTNTVFEAVNLNSPLSLVRLQFTIENSQPAKLELYEFEGQLSQEQILQYYEDNDPEKSPEFGGDVDEDFLGVKLGDLYGVRITDHVYPLSEGDSIETAEQVGYSDLTSAQWDEIIRSIVHDEPGYQPQSLSRFYAFGANGERHTLAEPMMAYFNTYEDWGVEAPAEPLPPEESKSEADEPQASPEAKLPGDDTSELNVDEPIVARMPTEEDESGAEYTQDQTLTSEEAIENEDAADPESSPETEDSMDEALEQPDMPTDIAEEPADAAENDTEEALKRSHKVDWVLYHLDPSQYEIGDHYILGRRG